MYMCAACAVHICVVWFAFSASTSPPPPPSPRNDVHFQRSTSVMWWPLSKCQVLNCRGWNTHIRMSWFCSLSLFLSLQSHQFSLLPCKSYRSFPSWFCLKSCASLPFLSKLVVTWDVSLALWVWLPTCSTVSPLLAITLHERGRRKIKLTAPLLLLAWRPRGVPAHCTYVISYPWPCFTTCGRECCISNVHATGIYM